MKRHLPAGLLAGLVLAGCTTTPSNSALPSGARLVGGGVDLKYEVPVDGTVILIERTSGRAVATESLSEGRTFEFGPRYSNFNEAMFALFGGTNTYDPGAPIALPTNAYFQLYFVPAKAKKS